MVYLQIYQTFFMIENMIIVGMESSPTPTHTDGGTLVSQKKVDIVQTNTAGDDSLQW